MSKLFGNNTQTAGNTPLVKINNISDGNIYVKVENRNPAMSVKCRIGVNMVDVAEKDGSLKPGMTIVEPTSGNTGIALSFVAAAKGYGSIMVMPNTMSLERRMLMKALGAEIVLTEGTGVHTNLKIRRIRRPTKRLPALKSGQIAMGKSIFSSVVSAQGEH